MQSRGCKSDNKASHPVALGWCILCLTTKIQQSISPQGVVSPLCIHYLHCIVAKARDFAHPARQYLKIAVRSPEDNNGTYLLIIYLSDHRFSIVTLPTNHITSRQKKQCFSNNFYDCLFSSRCCRGQPSRAPSKRGQFLLLLAVQYLVPDDVDETGPAIKTDPKGD